MNKNKKNVHILAGVILAGLIAVIVLLGLRGNENTTLIPHQDDVEQKVVYKTNKIAENADVNEVSRQLGKDNDSDAKIDEFVKQTTAAIVQESDALIEQPVHEGRKTLMDKIKTESFEECFMNTTDTYGLCMMIPSFGSFFFSPGFYSSDVMMIKSMDRTRKLVESVKQNPSESAEFLKKQVKEIGDNFDFHYSKYLEEIHNMSGSRTINDLPQSQKDRVRLTVAAYLLSEINAYESLPLLLNLSKSGNTRRQCCRDDAHANSPGTWPINPKFLIRSMHQLVANFPENLLNEQALQAKAEYLKKTDELKIPHPQTVNVTTWDSSYKEDDYRFQIPKLKRKYMGYQKKMDLTVYPLNINLDNNDVDVLLDKLENFCTKQFPNVN